MSTDTADWGTSLGNLALFRNDESGLKKTQITHKRGRYLKLVSDSASSPCWSEFNVYVENPGAAGESADDGDKEDERLRLGLLFFSVSLIVNCFPSPCTLLMSNDPVTKRRDKTAEPGADPA